MQSWFDLDEYQDPNYITLYRRDALSFQREEECIMYKDSLVRT